VLRRLLILAIAFAWLSGCGGQSTTPMYPVPPNGLLPGEPPSMTNGVIELPEPPNIKAVDGVARADLTANFDPTSGRPTLDYKGMRGITPTMRVNPGETIVLNLQDNLPSGGEKSDVNLHFHGMGSSPLPPGDDVLGTFARPGQKLHYVLHVPKNQQPGLYWYHMHIHGQVNLQVGESGMSGAIVVNGLEHHLPGLSKLKERLIIVRDVGMAKTLGPRTMVDGMPDMEPIRPRVINSNPCGPDLGLVTTLNGVHHPAITIAPGEKQFFRVINATGHKTLKLSVDGTKLELIAVDGFALDTYPGTPPTLIESSAIIPPAARAEFVVTGPHGRFAKFRTLCYDTGVGGDRDPNLVLADMRQPPNQLRSRLAAQGALKVGAPLPQNAYTGPLPPPSTKRYVVFSETNKQFLINGEAFSMNAPPMFVVHTGTVEEWKILNISQEVHDFHIHQIHFVVKQIDGVNLEHPYWADSVIIPHRKSNGHAGTLLLLMNFRDPVIKGTFVFHCHILDHEDRGMMAKIQAI
jgi:FtsP/CotA-like multicopper oxidase with cupredoxin domain